MSRDHIIQNIGSIIIFGAIVFGITVIMDMARDTEATKLYIQEDRLRVATIEKTLREQSESVNLRLDAIEKRNEEDAEFNELFLKMSGKLDALEIQIKALMEQLVNKEGTQ